MTIQAGTLYIVGTPIGNLEDITLRAIKILQSVDWIAAEDTRHTAKLLHHFDIKTSQLSYYEHNQHRRIPTLVASLRQGNAIALVTDAGMPGISDPGYELVKACIEAEIPVIPIPGVSASLTALSAAGLPTDRFVFEGFLPTKNKERQNRLTLLQTESRTLILYEAPHRLLETLTDLAQSLGSKRSIVIARELTKLHEEFWRGTLAEAVQYYQDHNPKGELTLVIAGITETATPLTEDQIKAELQRLIQEGMSHSEASRQIAEATSISRRQIYQLALTLPDLG
ncbi:Ribosomal RNA small subunit methyltransferase I [Planktothrix tepida]|uniref:Ribosomal RNA small subunit methyltransferase I n=2 Tax=Planktothrix TaxID=54304 RepID=A0A1J1LU53_9CYAN|nr:MULTISPECIES: 16S rRNA (cytidine(1402)-2'-O)-methyltransferase [Planktothrix]CAD5918743.1 Ribosomal RNA small subunit methyltransferase I [Planktothrix pseudagardhii]CAD5982067.1 Ribosomal RNA small subunit methyltransferase I [Planktothrix tepida]CUR35734.1 Ribosomal RNA small subunit methyltransferase I [Planktothrix tepida PCC 9214]